MVVKVTGKDPLQVAIVEDGNVVQTISANTADDPVIGELLIPAVRLKKGPYLGRSGVTEAYSRVSVVQQAVRILFRKPILRIDEVTGDIYGSLAAALRSAGRGAHTHRIQDLWIASQAIQHGMKLLTQNEKDFTDIPGLELVLLKGIHQ